MSTRIQKFALAALVAVAASGCVAVAVGAAAAFGAIKYSNNEASRQYERSLTTVWNATLAEMREMGYPVQEGTAHGPTEGRVDINDIDVRVEKISDGATVVRVRVGTFETEDHKRKARLLLDGIANRIS